MDEGPPQATTALAGSLEGGDRAMAAMVMQYAPMPPAMRRHYDCIRQIMLLELELLGEISPSVERDYERYRWWPLQGEPPRTWI